MVVNSDLVITACYHSFMSTITIPKPEYEVLKKRAQAYEELAGLFFKKAKAAPVEEIVEDFTKIGLYSKEFLHDLRIGLEHSSKSKNKR